MAGLFGVTMAASVVQPSVLIAVPFLLLAAVRGLKGAGLFVGAVVAMILAISGPQDGFWFLERAWAVLLGGWFVAVSMAMPRWPLSTKLLTSVAGAFVVTAAMLAARSGAWETVDWAITNAVEGGIATTLQALELLRGGDAISPALATAIHQTARAQTSVFPALMGIASMAGLAVAWWVYTRLRGEGDQAIGPVRNFRFNDHLVWLMIVGLLLVVTRWGDALARVGSNAVVFMGALYALRGSAVFMFISGGLSLFGYVLLALALVLAAPVVVGVAMVVGIGDTWLDVRARLRETAA
ncbi:MAG: DUF2232 domain-containing protein [Gemmatimonadota bacterium]|nr:DUF2232 domain-containing protein [Gemmatimonadota bacterium]